MGNEFYSVNLPGDSLKVDENDYILQKTVWKESRVYIPSSLVLFTDVF